MIYRPERGWGVHHNSPSSTLAGAETELDNLRKRLAKVEEDLVTARLKERESISRSMPLENDVVLPATHAEKNFPQQGKVVQVPGVDGGLSRRAKG